MPPINRDLTAALSTVQRPGDFYVSGRSEIFAPRLSVDGVGLISLPLQAEQAERLAAVAERAPYGRGPETLVDTEVRRTWQIAPEHVHIGGRHWQQSLDAIVGRCACGLGIATPVRAELYKMLVYDTGSFFVGHRDTEKAPGMFATLVVVLPSQYTGGELRVRHQAREVSLDLSSDDASEVAFAAFYADCWHEVRPVDSGCRLALIYNLIRPGPGRLPQPPDYGAQIDRVTALLRHWASTAGGGEAPDKLIYPLEHIYTPAEIGFSRLKNADAAVAGVLIAAAARANCDLYLALVNIEESGTAEHVVYRRRRYYDDDDEPPGKFETGEVTERSLTLSDWRTPDDQHPALTWLPFDESDLCPPDAFADAEPDEQHFFEATGNAGASFERTYRRAAFVLWPQARRLEVIATAGQEVSLPYLTELAERCAADQPRDGQVEEPDAHAPVWHDAHRLAMLILEHWPEASRWSWHTQQKHVQSFLNATARLHDREAIVALLGEIMPRGHFGHGATDALLTATRLLPAPQVTSLIERIIVGNAADQPAACAELLRAMADQLRLDPDSSARGTLAQAAVAVITASTGQPQSGGRDAQAVTPRLVADMLTALARLDALEIGEQLVRQLLDKPQTYGRDAVLVPAALDLASRAPAVHNWPPVRDLLQACLRHLAQRIAEPLAPPADFARPSQLGCRCPNCTQLSAFLADPRQKQWIFKAAQAQRSHIEDTIQRDRCDVDTETVRRGSPHELHCTKNQASYGRRVAQREEDLRNERRLKGSTGGQM